MHLVFSTVTLFAVGYAIFMRRQSWRTYVWQEVLTLGIGLQGLAFILCLPSTSWWLGNPLLAATGTSHMNDYLGHLAFLAAVSCIICAVAFRLIPEKHMEHFMSRVEVPGALGAFAMLLCITFSRRTHPGLTVKYMDFFDVPQDTWLTAYWLICGAIALYLVGVLIWLLLVLRLQEPRSRLTCDLFIASTAIGAGSTITRLIMVLEPSWHIPGASVWGLLSISITLSSWAAAISWRRTVKGHPPPRR